MPSNINNKKIIMVIAHRDFRDEEYFIPLHIFQQEGFNVTTAGSKKGMALGALGGETEIELDIKDVDKENFDAIVFVGGNGAQEYFENTSIHKLIRDFHNAEKLVAAICIAPVILAKAGILKDQTATVWQNALDKTGPKALSESRCILSQKTVEESNNIITANGREAAEEFANAIIKKLS